MSRPSAIDICKYLSKWMGREGAIIRSVLREVKFRDTLRNFHDRRNNCAIEDDNHRGGLSRENFGTLHFIILSFQFSFVIILAPVLFIE